MSIVNELTDNFYSALFEFKDPVNATYILRPMTLYIKYYYVDNYPSCVSYMNCISHKLSKAE
jgi:hypothetical protein